jgi:flavin-dependent dehydrogenase
MQPFDALILGGGPAGSAAARFLSLWGHRVALLTRAPASRSLAESLPPSCTKLLERLGLRAEVEHGGFVRSTGNTVRWGGEAARVEPFGAGEAGFQVQRDVFDALLLQGAVAAGSAITVSATARSVNRLDQRIANGEGPSDPWTIVYDVDGETRTLTARWVLDCTGRVGLMARQGLRRAEPGTRTMALIGVWERDDAWGMTDDSHTLVESYDGGWAWSVPVSARKRYVTVMVDPSITPLPTRQHLAAAYRAELNRASALTELVAGARLATEPWACDASGFTADRFAGPGFMLVGDAGSFVDPLSSFGVKKALASAWLAAVVVHTCLDEPSMEAAALDFFDSRERTMYEQLRRQSAALARGARSAHETDFWRERSTVGDADSEETLDIAALRTDPRVLAAFSELKQRPAIKLTLSPNARVVRRPTVQGDRLVLGDHLSAPNLGDGIRYLRSVDLMLLSRLARDCHQVPDLFDAYNRAAPPAPLPDFLGALSVLVGLDVLALA